MIPGPHAVPYATPEEVRVNPTEMGAKVGRDNYAYKAIGTGSSGSRILGEVTGPYGGWDQTGGWKDGSGPDKGLEVFHV